MLLSPSSSSSLVRWRVHFFLLPSLIYKCISASLKGSVSAEHGIGSAKTHALHYSKNDVSIQLMRRLKNMFDPNGILNPGKVFAIDSNH
jgi:hypothetical protein